MTGWSFVNGKWAMDGLEVTNFKKDIIPAGKLNGTNYAAILKKNPISFAITGTKQIEYTKNNNLF